MSAQSLLLVVAALCGGAVVKGATGMGLPLIALPGIAAVLGVPHAIAVMTVPILVTNAWQIRQTWHHRSEAGFLPAFLLAGVIGVALGTWMLSRVSAAWLSVCLGVMLAGYIAIRVAVPALHLGGTLGRRLAPWFGLGAGVLQGVSGLSAPIGVTFIHALRLSRELYVFSVSCIFLLFAVVQIPSLAVAGIMTWTRLLESVLAVLPVVVAMPLGTFMSRFMSRETFDRVILLILAALSVRLLAEGLR